MIASSAETDSSAKRISEMNSSRRAYIIIKQFWTPNAANANHQLKQMTNNSETFSFSQSFWNRLNEEDESGREADNSDNQSARPARECCNVTKRKGNFEVKREREMLIDWSKASITLPNDHKNHLLAMIGK